MDDANSGSAGDFAIFTKGTAYNIKCPFCGQNNLNVCQGAKKERGKVSFFSRPCFACGKTVYYQAQYELLVIAEKDNFASEVPDLGQPLVRRFLAVFTDILQSFGNKPQTRILYGKSEEDVVCRYGLVQRKHKLPGYWDGNNGDVIINLYEIEEEEILDKGQLNEYVRCLQRAWY